MVLFSPSQSPIELFSTALTPANHGEWSGLHGRGDGRCCSCFRRPLADSGLTASLRRRWLLFLLFSSVCQSEVEETLERIKAHKGVEGVIIGEGKEEREGKEREGGTRGGWLVAAPSVPPRLSLHGGHRPPRCCAAATDDDHAMRYRGAKR